MKILEVASRVTGVQTLVDGLAQEKVIYQNHGLDPNRSLPLDGGWPVLKEVQLHRAKTLGRFTLGMACRAMGITLAAEAVAHLGHSVGY